ncbi:MAG: GNAT family N-acetyltransferase [Rubrobacter sp.]|nr:GNAT family N-acetyltransferase [Rubrobacter sp.]
MRIRRAADSDADTLTAVAHAAKRHWGYPERWIGLWREQLTLTPEYLRANEVHVAEEDPASEPFAFYALAPGYLGRGALDHLWVRPERMGEGVGATLFRHALERARELGHAGIEIESDPNALGFYLAAGARQVGESSGEIDGEPRLLPVLIADARGGAT